ncbi:MAG: hypothetical protein ABI091_22410 [Ferruginibacter sp.]
MSIKLRLIFLPLFFIIVCFIGIYSLLDWYFIIQPQVTSINENITNFWLPIVLPWIPVLIWLRPRLKLLDLKKKSSRSDPLFGMMFLATFAIAAPTIITQFFIESDTGKLTPLENINGIKKAALTKYYSLKKYYIDKADCGIYRTYYVSGKYNSTLNFSMYIACPIFDTGEVSEPIPYVPLADKTLSISITKPMIILDGKEVDSSVIEKISPNEVKNITVLKGASAKAIYGSKAAKGVVVITTKRNDTAATGYQNGVHHSVPEPKAWLCLSYSKHVSNRKPDAEKLQLRIAFYDSSLQLFKDSNLHQFVYLERTGYTDSRQKFRHAVETAHLSADVDNAIQLKPVFTSFDKRNGYKEDWIFGSFAIGAALFILVLCFFKLDENKVDLATGEMIVQ